MFISAAVQTTTEPLRAVVMEANAPKKTQHERKSLEL